MKIDQTLKAESKIEERVFTVSEFLDFINEALRPCRAIIQGEIGEKINNYPRFTFFRLLDKNNSILECFTWREKIESLGMELESGMKIRVIGYPEVRRDKGELKFQVERIELIGEGILKKQFEILKKKLSALGYFDLKFKKPIPRFCENIGIITSKYGKGGLKDFKTHLENFGLRVFFYDTRVEGSFAIPEIQEGIRWFNQNLPKIDVLVLTRGGGGWESLQPFNSEELAKAIFASKIPIITGIGHEDDETLVDFVADLRASTPTHAAEILSENWKSASVKVYEFKKNINVSINNLLRNFKEKVHFFEGSFNSIISKTCGYINEKIIFFEKNLITKVKGEILLEQKGLDSLVRNLSLGFQNYFRELEILERGFKRNFLKIKSLIKNQKIKIEQFLENLIKNKNRWREEMEDLLKQQEGKLIPSSPQLKLKQGYTITSDEFGKIIKDPTRLKIKQTIQTKFYKGRIFSTINKIKK